jgi:RNA polymerase primary sigma factor
VAEGPIALAEVSEQASPDGELIARVLGLLQQHFVVDGRLTADDLDAVQDFTDLPDRLLQRLRDSLTSLGVSLVEATESQHAPSAASTRAPLHRPCPEGFDDADQFVRVLEQSKRDLLSAAQEKRLGRIVQACGVGDRSATGFDDVDPARVVELGRRARSEFERRNLRLVYWLARHYASQGMEVEDLIQEGWFGLRRAVEKFDPERGLKFSTYATWWVRQAVTRALADKARLIRLPVHVVESLQKVMRIRERMLLTTGRVSVREIAEQTGYSAGKVRRLIRLARGPLSLDSPVGDGLNVMGDLLPSGVDVEDTVERQQISAIVERTLTTLPDRECEVIQRRFGVGGGELETLEEIGRTWGVTRERVRQVEAKALEHLRTGDRRRSLQRAQTAE